MAARFFVWVVAGVVWSMPHLAMAGYNPWTHTFYFENDLFNGTDSNYTNGVKYSLISPDLSPHAAHAGLPQNILDVIQQLPFIGESGPEYTHKAEFSFGQNMYTPADIARNDLIAEDRPYAGWSYFGLAYHRQYVPVGHLAFLDTVEVQFGLVGPESFAEETQKLVHNLRRLQRPNGWDHQLKNEPAGAVSYERKWLFYSDRNNVVDMDCITHAGAALGNVYTYGNAGLEIRLGWNIPINFGVSLIRPAGSTRLDAADSFSFYVFTAANNKLVLRDIFLDGNTLADSHSVSKKSLVSDVAAGLTISYHSFMLTVSQVLRTKEYRGQQDDHSFGSMTLSFFVDFF